VEREEGAKSTRRVEIRHVVDADAGQTSYAVLGHRSRCRRGTEHFVSVDIAFALFFAALATRTTLTLGSGLEIRIVILVLVG
jgi:hypothetical protein